MKKILSFSLLFSAIFALSDVAIAKDKVIAPIASSVCVVEVAKVLHDSPQVKKDVAQLKEKFKKDQDAIEAKQTSLQKDMQNLKKNDSVMSSADRAKSEKMIAEKRQALIKEVGDFQQKLTSEQKSMMDSVFKDLNTVVQSVAQAKACDVVLDSQFVLYATPAHDVTADVEKQFDKK